MPEREDEFYVGYLPNAPRGISARTRFAVATILLLAVLVGLLLVNSQRTFAPSVFEFGVATELEGVVRESPYPMLSVLRPGKTGEGLSRFSSYYLVAGGKHGAASLVQGMDGRAVRLHGSLVYRDDKTLVEVESGTIELLEGEAATALESLASPVEETLGTRALVGEIVDGKCFLGVMKPGNLKPHRSCAVRCISGGIPPVLLVRDSGGSATYFLLVSENGGAVNDRVLDLVAEPVEITGRVARRDDVLLLYADPATYRRIPRRNGS